jgi:hypothetical protein
MLAKVQHLTLASTTIIKNTKDKSITITLSDNLPRPNDDRIKVRVLEPDLMGPQKSVTSVKLNPNTQVSSLYSSINLLPPQTKSNIGVGVAY